MRGARFKVSFDDGGTFEVVAKARDIALAERQGLDVNTAPPVFTTYAVALAALGRMQRAGDIPADVKLPESVDSMLDVADVEDLDDGEDPEGKG